MLFFGYAKQLTGTRHFLMTLDDFATLDDCKKLLEKEFPELKVWNDFAFAINKEYVNQSDITLSSGDELAVLPPVSGG